MTRIPKLFLTFTLLSLSGCSEQVARRGDAGRPDAASHDGPRADAPRRDAAVRADSAPAGDGALADGPQLADLGPTSAKILLQEDFEDTNFATRGWYDAPKGTLSSSEHKQGQRALECRFLQGKQGCQGGKPGRHLFESTETAYLAYWVKYSANWVGSGKPYHPHEFHFATTADSKWVGPANSHLTTYIEQVGGVPRLALQDSMNVDPNCILLNNDNFVGCNGSFDSYGFSEQRSVCSCNGIVGELDRRDCYKAGAGYWYSSRAWRAPDKYFADQPGPRYKGDWHRVEALFKMNSIQGGKGVADGSIRYWYDGQLIIASDKILLRTGKHPQLAFNQLIIAPYIGDGSPVEQTMWIDALVVATGRP